MKNYKLLICILSTLFLFCGISLILQYLYTIPINRNLDILHEFIKVIFLFLLIVANIHLWWTIDRDREHVKHIIQKITFADKEINFKVNLLWVIIISTVFISPIVVSYWYEASFDKNFVPSVYLNIHYNPYYVYEDDYDKINDINYSLHNTQENMVEIARNINEIFKIMNTTYTEMINTYEYINNSDNFAYVKFTDLKYAPEILLNFNETIQNISQINNTISKKIVQTNEDVVLYDNFLAHHTRVQKNQICKDEARLNRSILKHLDNRMNHKNPDWSHLSNTINTTESCTYRVSSKTNEYYNYANNSHAFFSEIYKSTPTDLNRNNFNNIYGSMNLTYVDMHTITTHLILTTNIMTDSQKSVNYVTSTTVDCCKPFSHLLIFIILLYEFIIYILTFVMLSVFLRNFLVVSNATYILIRNLSAMNDSYLGESEIHFDLDQPDYIKYLSNIRNMITNYTLYYITILGLSILTYIVKIQDDTFVSNYIESLCITIYIFIILILFCIALKKLIDYIYLNIYDTIIDIEAEMYITNNEKTVDALDKKRNALRNIIEDFILRKNLLPYISGLASLATLLYILSLFQISAVH